MAVLNQKEELLLMSVSKARVPPPCPRFPKPIGSLGGGVELGVDGEGQPILITSNQLPNSSDRCKYLHIYPV